MHFIMKLTKRTAVVVLLSSGAFALSGVTYAATLNQNLVSVGNLPVVVDLEGSLPVRAMTRPQLQAQAKTKAAQPAAAIAPAPSSADIVNKLLSPGPSDPNVPLPRADLAGQTAESGSSKKPQIFGRGEDGGGVFGLRVPIPAGRNASGSNTRYSPR
jgi:hypothetical protein